MRFLAERAMLREDVAISLYELGGTAADVAVSLTSIGVPVWPASGNESPAARYLHAVVGADTRVTRVRITKRWLVITPHQSWTPTIRLRLPGPVREFVASVEEIPTYEETEIPFEDNQA